MAGTEELPALIETAEDLMHVVIEDVHWLLVRVSKEKTEAEIKKRHSEYGEHVRMLKGVMERINEVVEGKEFQSGSIETDEIRALRERKETLRQEAKEKNQTIKGVIDRLRQLQAGMATLKGI